MSASAEGDGRFQAAQQNLPTRAEIERLERKAKASDLFAAPDGRHCRVSLHGWFWCLLFGPFYFAYYRMWAQFFISLAAALLTCGLSWAAYPFFARPLVRRQLLQEGYLPL